MATIQRTGVAGIQKDPDTIRFVDRLDTDLSHYFEINVDDSNNLIDFLAKIGDFRFKDADDSDNSDTFQLTLDDAGGSALLKTSCITDKNIFEIAASGTYSGASATVDINFIELDIDGMTINDAATNAVTLKGINIDMDGITATAATLSAAYGLFIDMPSVGVYATISGAEIYVDSAEASNLSSGLIISKDLSNTAAGAGIAQTNSALNIAQISSNDEAQIMTVSNTVADITVSNTASAAGADVYAGTVMNLDYSAITDGTGTATSSATALSIDYNLTETAGTLTLNSFNVAYIDFDTSGTVSYAAGTYRGLYINMADANTPTHAASTTFYGLEIDVSSLDDSDTDLTLYGFKSGIGSLVGVALERAAGFFTDAVHTAKMSDGSMGISATGINDEKYYRCEDFDEEAAAVTLDAGLRGDEWTFGGTNGDAGDVTYIQDTGGVIQLQTDGMDNDSVYALWLNTAVNTTANPIIEFRVQIDAIGASSSGFAVGLAETGTFTTMAFDGADDDFILVGMDTDLGTPANLRLWTEDNNGGENTVDLGVAIAATTWCTIRIDCTDTEQPRVWINNTGGAISPNDEIAAATIGASANIQDAIYMYPVLFVVSLDAGSSTAELLVDYIKIWQDRA